MSTSTVLVPPAWHDARGARATERAHTAGYELAVIPLRRNGHFHTHYYPTLTDELRRRRPTILHMDEEPYNFATWRGVRAAAQLGIRPLFFTWQNIEKRYPLPFGWFERECYRRAPAAIAGNQDAATILQRKGFRGRIAVIPQFGVDPIQFTPGPPHAAGFTVGYAGGLLTEKGVGTLLRACMALPGAWTLRFAGQGDQRAATGGDGPRRGRRRPDRLYRCPPER